MKTETFQDRYGGTVTIREMTADEYREFRANMDAQQLAALCVDETDDPDLLLARYLIKDMEQLDRSDEVEQSREIK